MYTQAIPLKLIQNFFNNTYLGSYTIISGILVVTILVFLVLLKFVKYFSKQYSKTKIFENEYTIDLP